VTGSLMQIPEDLNSPCYAPKLVKSVHFSPKYVKYKNGVDTVYM